MSELLTKAEEATTTTVRDIYLSQEERYDVWVVKCAERPELLLQEAGATTTDTDAKDDEPLPLVDGCDLPSWRQERLAWNEDNKQELTCVLNVGPGCSLLRRESQIPILGPSSSSSGPSATLWEGLRKRLLEPPSLQIERLSYKDCRSLHQPFERDNVPVLIEGCADDWLAMETCQFERLVKRFGHVPWRFSDTHGETMTLRTYQKYLSCIDGALTDDAPLAVYDSQFGYDTTDEDEEEEPRSAILNEYTVPSCFDTDLFALIAARPDDEQADESHRPPYRWILIGPERSGTGLHVDPVGTHAWVTLIQGLKRWVLFPPDTPQAAIHMQEPQIPSVLWFRDYYEQALNDFPGAVEVLQRPGETVYVPAGWPHLVLNLELSVAMTHNYATQYPSMERLLTAVEQAEPDLAVRFQQALAQQRPELLTMASSLSDDDDKDLSPVHDNGGEKENTNQIDYNKEVR